MKRFMSLLLVVCMALSMLSTAAAAAEGQELNWSSAEKELLTLINKERLANGLSPLSVSGAMLEAADMREQDFVSRYGANRPNGDPGLSVLDAKGIRYSSAGELMAVGQSTPRAALNYWLKNENYRAEILNPDYSHVGVGYTKQSCTITTETGVGRIRGGWVLQFVDDGCTAEQISLSESSVRCETQTLENLGLLLSETCSVHGVCSLPLADELCAEFYPGVPGEQNVTVSYKGCSAALQVTVPQGSVVAYRIVVDPVTNGSVTVGKKSAVAGEAITVAVAPEQGYRLAGLFVNGVKQDGLTFTMPAEDVTLSAVFVSDAPDVYSVTVGTVSNGAVTTDKAFAVVGDVINVTAQPDEGYAFKQVLVDDEAVSGMSFVMPARDVVVTAEFYAIVYDVVVGEVFHGSLTVDKETATKGETVTITAQPNEGYVLKEILVDGETILGSAFTVSGNHVITAVFTPKTNEAQVNGVTANSAQLNVKNNGGTASQIIVAFYSVQGQMLAAQVFDDVAAGESTLTITEKRVDLTAVEWRVFFLNEQGVPTSPAVTP